MNQNPRTWDLGTLGPGTRDPPQKLKVGSGTLLKSKSGTPGLPSKFKIETTGPPLKFKSGTPSPFFNEFIFVRIFHRMFLLIYCCIFLKDTQREKTPWNKTPALKKVQIWAFGYNKSTLYKRFLNWNKIFKKIMQLLAKLRFLW